VGGVHEKLLKIVCSCWPTGFFASLVQNSKLPEREAIGLMLGRAITRVCQTAGFAL
jgi:hypothetical protein